MEANEEFFNRKKQELNVTLNEVQKQAVLHGRGHCSCWHLLAQVKRRR